MLISFAKAPIARKCTEFSDCSASDASQSYALLLGGDEADEADAAAPMPRACNLYCEKAENNRSKHSCKTKSKHKHGVTDSHRGSKGRGRHRDAKERRARPPKTNSK